jgi:hypothetical protein
MPAADAFSRAFGGDAGGASSPAVMEDAFSRAFGTSDQKPEKATVTVQSMDEYGRPIPGASFPTAPAPTSVRGTILQGPNVASVPSQGVPEPAADVLTGAAGRVGSAAVQGFQNMPGLLTPEAQAANDQTIFGRYVSNPLATIESLPLKTLGALGGAGGQLLYEGGNLLGGPTLGRDLYMGGQVAPFAGMGAGLPRSPGMEAPVARPQFVGERFAPTAIEGQGTLGRINQLVAHDTAETAGIGPQTQQDNLLAYSNLGRENAAIPGGSVGAASRDESQAIPGLTVAQQQTGLAKSVAQTAADRAGPQNVDHSTYVPGVVRPLAAREFSPANSVAEKTFHDTDPLFKANLDAIEKHNQDTMKDYFQAPEVATPEGGTAPGIGAGDAIALERLREARNEVTPPSLKIFDQEKPVDASDVVAKIDKMLVGPEGKRDAVVSVLKNARAKLFDQNGDLETLPSQLYGARQNITDMLRGKGLTKEQSDAQLAKGQLENVLDALDPKIAEGAPKFADYIGPGGLYAQASQPITAMRFLQSYGLDTGKLTGADGNLQFSKVQKLLQTVAKQRAESGVQPAKALTEDQVQAIINLRNELGAMHYRDQLARVRGSDTTQKLSLLSRVAASPLAKAAAPLAEGGAHALMFTSPYTSGVGNALLFAGRMGKNYYTAAQAKNAVAASEAMKARLLETTPPPEAP